MLAKSKLNSIEIKIFEALINSEISHEDLKTVIDKEKNYCELKESIRTMLSIPLKAVSLNSNYNNSIK